MNTKKIITYGSLRKGMYNYEALKDGIEYIDTTTIKGFRLHDYGAYPFAVEGEGEMVVDILEVEEEMYEAIKRMELGAGYIEKEITIGDTTGYIYLFRQPTNNRIVEHGDWVKYKGGKL